MKINSLEIPKLPKVVILGAGFGGLWSARLLARYKANIVVLDRNNFHTFLPLLYQVAAAELEPEEIVYPLRSILRRYPNVLFLMNQVTRIDTDAKVVETTEHTFPYDFLILAMGSASHFFGIPGAEQHAFQLKTLEQAIKMRNHILYRFERALCESEAEIRRRMLTFAIVGGGPTGVEFAGALAELIRGPLIKDYPNLDFNEVRVMLLEATDHLLTGFPERLQNYAVSRLRSMGIEVQLGAVVSEISPQSLRLKDGSLIPLETVVWTAGVRGLPLEHTGELPLARNGRIKVLSTLQVPEHPEIYVAGDLAHIEEDSNPLPMVAPVAIQQGEMAARNISRQLEGKQPLPFHYKDPGTMVTIGRNAAVALVKGRAFTGFPAWLLWLGVHLYNLIGFRNRLLVMINWAWDYLFYDRAVRLITPSIEESNAH
jgi:NADH:quinone reductase (non-electrogenic)